MHVLRRQHPMLRKWGEAVSTWPSIVELASPCRECYVQKTYFVGSVVSCKQQRVGITGPSCHPISQGQREVVYPVGERHVLSRVIGADERRSDFVNQSISVVAGAPFLVGFGRGKLLCFPQLE